MRFYRAMGVLSEPFLPIAEDLRFFCFRHGLTPDFLRHLWPDPFAKQTFYPARMRRGVTAVQQNLDFRVFDMAGHGRTYAYFYHQSGCEGGNRIHAVAGLRPGFQLHFRRFGHKVDIIIQISSHVLPNR